MRARAALLNCASLAGWTSKETAHVLGVSVGTVRRDWSLARAWLYRELHHATKNRTVGNTD